MCICIEVTVAMLREPSKLPDIVLARSFFNIIHPFHLLFPGCSFHSNVSHTQNTVLFTEFIVACQVGQWWAKYQSFEDMLSVHQEGGYG